MSFIYTMVSTLCNAGKTIRKFDASGCLDFNSFCKLFSHSLSTNSSILNQSKYIFLNHKAAWNPRGGRKNICGERLREFCDKYILNITPYFNRSWIGAAIVILGLVLSLMSMAAVLNDSSARQEMQRLTTT